MKQFILLLLFLSHSLIAHEIGIKSTFYQKNETYSTKPYLYFSDTFKLTSESNIHFAARGNLDIPETKKQKIDIRELYYKKSGNHYSLDWGLQVFNWSETFGVNIMDLVNPRDYHEFIFDDLNWSQIPVWSLKTTLTFGEVTFIPIYTLKARKNIYPNANDYYDFVPLEQKNLERVDTQNYKYFKDSEYGLKLNYLLFNNLDLSLIYFNHFNRKINYTFRDYKLYTLNERVQSYGLTYSYTIESLVFRGDTLFTKRDFQGIYGVDRNFNQSWLVGMQYHFDNTINKTWGAIKVQKELDTTPLTLSVMHFWGINNDDFWTRPELIYNAKNGITYPILADIFTKDNRDGLLKEFNHKNRLLFNFNYIF